MSPASAQAERLSKAWRFLDLAISHMHRVGNDADYAKACGALRVLQELRDDARRVARLAAEGVR